MQATPILQDPVDENANSFTALTYSTRLLLFWSGHLTRRLGRGGFAVSSTWARTQHSCTP
jgi:hypothetical protein